MFQSFVVLSRTVYDLPEGNSFGSLTLKLLISLSMSVKFNSFRGAALPNPGGGCVTFNGGITGNTDTEGAGLAAKKNVLSETWPSGAARR